MSADQAGALTAAIGLPAPQRSAPISPQLFEALVRHSQDVIALISADGRILYASPACTRLLGFTPDELLAQPFVFAYVHPDDRPRAETAFGGLLQQPGATVTERIRSQRKDGSWCWVDATGTNLLHDPEVGAIVANYRDATTRVEQEAERARQDKLEGALLVARTAAHELLNALQPVRGFAELLSLDPDARVHPRLATLARHIIAGTLDAAERVRRLEQVVRLEENTTLPEHSVLDLERSTTRD
jgi:PAS domain S-box-containing protein